jgi:uncharacterized protein (TIGR02594 family)
MKAIEQAFRYYGLKETSGDEHTKQIVQFFSDLGHSWVDDDETAWCAAFVNWCLKMTSHEHSGALNARSLLELDNAVKSPVFGDVLIFWRITPDSVYGHVGFYVTENKDYYYVLGGNQNNQVKISEYKKDRLLGIRRPIKL